MTINNSRSMNAELAEGMSDGIYKKLDTDRGGSINSETHDKRAQLSASFDFAEAKVKHLGDGSVHVTPDYVSLPIAHAAGLLY